MYKDITVTLIASGEPSSYSQKELLNGFVYLLHVLSSGQDVTFYLKQDIKYITVINTNVCWYQRLMEDDVYKGQITLILQESSLIICPLRVRFF